MKINRIVKLHPCIVEPDIVSNLITPLKYLGISYFGHAKKNNSTGEVTGVSSNAKYLACYLENKLFDLDLHTRLDIDRYGYVHWDYIDYNKEASMYFQIKRKFKIFHTFTIARKYRDSTNLYHFSTNKLNPEINEVYVKNLDLLYKFINYYEVQSLYNKSLAAAHKIIIPVKKSGATTSSKLLVANKLSLPFSKRELFLKKIRIDSVKTDNLSVGLSVREMDCAKLLLKGDSSKEMAEKLGISPRTVEIYIEKLKIKFNAKNKIALVVKIMNYFYDVCS